MQFTSGLQDLNHEQYLLLLQIVLRIGLVGAFEGSLWGVVGMVLNDTEVACRSVQ